jgi:hypothetical protein
VDPLSMPDDITTLSDDDLATLLDQITTQGEELASGDATEEAVTALERLVEAKDMITNEQTARAAAVAELSTRQAEAASRFRPADADADGDPDGEGGEGDDAPTEGDADAPAGNAPLVTAVAASGSKRGAGAALTARRPAGAAPRKTARGDFMTATSHALAMPEGRPFEDALAVATAITKKRHSFTLVGAGVRDYVPIAQGIKPIEHAVGGDAVENFGTLRNLQVETPALVASGATCAPFAPSYEFFRLAEAQNPMESSIPVVQAPRGGIRYIVPPSVTLAAGAIDISHQNRNYAANADGPKACITVTCPDVGEEEVVAVSRCVTFDNLKYKVFPEQVASFLEDVAVQFTTTKEVFYLDYINSHSTPVTADFGYGASKSLLADWTVATIGYRKRFGMARGSQVIVAAPDWALDEIKLDMALQFNDGNDFWGITDAQVEAFLRARGISPIWYNDNPTGVTPNQKFAGAQAAGALNRLPTKVVSYVYAPGTFVRLDGGTLDVGLVRDSVLNRTNDLQLFMEEWIGMAKLGFESIRLTSTACANGASPLGVTARTCP